MGMVISMSRAGVQVSIIKCPAPRAVGSSALVRAVAMIPPKGRNRFGRNMFTRQVPAAREALYDALVGGSVEPAGASDGDAVTPSSSQVSLVIVRIPEVSVETNGLSLAPRILTDGKATGDTVGWEARSSGLVLSKKMNDIHKEETSLRKM